MMENVSMQMQPEERKPTKEEISRLEKKYAIKHFIIGMILLVIGVIGFIIAWQNAKSPVRVYDPSLKIGMAFGIVAIAGIWDIIEFIQKKTLMKLMKVMKIYVNEVTNKKEYGITTYTAHIQFYKDGEYKDMKVPILKDAADSVEGKRYGKLFFIDDKGYIIDKI